MSQSPLAPIALFVYNRLDHTHKTIEALRRNFLCNESDLYIFSDGAKNEDGKASVQAVRDYLKTINGFKNISIITKDKNNGLANSIISGVSEIVAKHGKVIVMEDDLVTSPYFLQFMNDGLNFYENNEEVVSIHGYVYPVDNLPNTFFLRGADCWGWATWARGWKVFNPNGSELLKKLQDGNLTREFDLDKCYPYTQMLKDQIDGKNNSWAIRWHASAFLSNKLTLYPGKSLVKNIGIDGSGTHCADMTQFDTQISQEKIIIKNIPLAEDRESQKRIARFLKPKRPNAV